MEIDFYEFASKLRNIQKSFHAKVNICVTSKDVMKIMALINSFITLSAVSVFDDLFSI